MLDLGLGATRRYACLADNALIEAAPRRDRPHLEPDSTNRGSRGSVGRGNLSTRWRPRNTAKRGLPDRAALLICHMGFAFRMDSSSPRV